MIVSNSEYVMRCLSCGKEIKQGCLIADSSEKEIIVNYKCNDCQ